MYKLKSSGFTLIELLVVIVMIGILAAIAVPDFRQYQMREQLQASVNGTKALFSEAFSQARSQSQDQQLSILSDQALEFCNQPQPSKESEEKEPEITCSDFKLPGNITMTLEPETITEWRYLAPHGDIADLTEDLVFTLTHSSDATRKIKLHFLSGLAEEL